MKKLITAALLLALSTPSLALPVPDPPNLDASSFVLMDFATGQILASREPHKRIEPASITKVMTSYIAFAEIRNGQIALEDTVLVSENAWRKKGSSMFLQVGTKVTVEELLKGIIIQSGNDASIAMAEYLAGGEETFAALMNQYAQRLGMTNSHFTNATGWPDENHYTTAYDIALLSHALIRDFPDFYKLYKQRKYTYNNIPQYNRNKLLSRDESVDGIKTGHTESAGYCLAASAVRDDRRLISVLLGASDEDARADGSMALMNYGFRFFETVPLYSANEEVSSVRAWKSEQGEVKLGLASDLVVSIPRGERRNLDIQPSIDQRIIAPVRQGQVLGLLEIRHNGEVIRSEPLIALETIEKGGLIRQLIDEIRLRMQ